MRTIALALLLAVPGATAGVAISSFLGASAGTPVAWTGLPLPPVKPNRPAADLLCTGPFAPTLQELLYGETVITTEAQMKLVWARLFQVPYEPLLFDFDTDFVVLMGGGLLTMESFSLSAVERADGSYFSLFGGGNDPFLVVTSTKVLPGIPPPFPPPPHYVVSAARVPKGVLDDVVFHRAIFAAP